MQDLVQQLIIGLSIGATYALIALGYTMVYGVLRLINFAHGEVYMAGGVVGWYLAQWVTQVRMPVALRLAIVFGGAMAFCTALGFLIEFLAYRPLRAKPRLVVLITAIGVSLLFQNLAQLPSVFGPTPRQYPHARPKDPFDPDAKPKPPYELIESRTLFRFHVGTGEVTVSNHDVLSLSLAIGLMGALSWIVLKTKVGLALRAVSHRVDTAALMGVNTDRTISYTFMLGSALAAVAGVMDGIRYDVKPLMGLLPGLKAFIAAVLGGIGSIPGAFLGALLLGVVETLAKFLLPRGYTEYADAVAFVVLILVLLFRPSGLLGAVQREKV
jgi:branched-chain amino acid transport system permease protein